MQNLMKTNEYKVDAKEQKQVDGWRSGLTTEVVLEMHGNVTDKQAGLLGLLPSRSPKQGESTQTHMNICEVSLHSHKVPGFRSPSMKGEHTS